MADIHVKGLAQLNEFLQQLPVKIEKNLLRQALRRGMNVTKDVARRNVRSASGKLAKGLKVGTRSKGGRVMAYLKASGVHAFVGHFLEFTGAKAHQIAPKIRGGKVALAFNGKFYRKVEHKGFRKRPFMRPALDATAGAAVIAVGEYLKAQLATKHGLDTSGVTIEGDEQ